MSMSDVIIVKDIIKLDLFEFIKIFFTDVEKYKRIDNKVKIGHMRAMYRLLAIYFPKEIADIAYVYNYRILDSLHIALCKNKGRILKYPSYKKTKSYDLLAKHKENVLSAFCQIQKIERKSLNLMVDLYPEFVKKELLDVEKQINSKVKKIARGKKLIN